MSKSVETPPGAWDEPLDPNLLVNTASEPQTPFALYVQPKPAPTGEGGFACSRFRPRFPQFCLLPFELQHYILSFCCSSTLFQLMQISVTRYEAKKLFWSNRNTWYCVDGDWLNDGAYPGETYYDPTFLAHVKQVNICFDYLEPETFTRIPKNMSNHYYYDDRFFEHATDQVIRDMEDNIRRFWQTLSDLCPRISRVLISPSSTRDDQRGLLKAFHGKFLRLCPARASVSLSLLQGDDWPDARKYKSRKQRSLWRLVNNKQWDKVLADWTPLSVLLPPKLFSGPVGAFQECFYKFHRGIMQSHAAKLLLINAVERYHFQKDQKPFVCYTWNCNTLLKSPGDYLNHAIENGHENILISAVEKLGDMHLRTLFSEHREKVERLYDTNSFERYEPFDLDTSEYEKFSNISNQAMSPNCHKDEDEDQAMIYEMEKEELYWKEYFDKQILLDQRDNDAKRAFIYQLRHDPSYATRLPVNQCHLWVAFTTHINEIRGHDYDFRRSLGIFRYRRYTDTRRSNY